MDSPLLLFALVAAIIVIAMLLPRWIRRSSGTRGRRAGRRFEEDQLVALLEELGIAVDLHTDRRTAREIVDGAARSEPRKFTVLDDGAYGIRFVEPDDAVAHLVPIDAGSRLQIVEFREYLGRPNTAGFWRDLRATVTEGAQAHGVAHSTPPSPSLFRRSEDPEPRWRLSEREDS